MQNPSEMAESKLDNPEMFHGFSSKNAQTLRLFVGKNQVFFQRRAAGSSGYKLHMACDTFPTSVNHHRGFSVGNPGRIRRKKAAKWWSITDVTI
jgi:hypothetical protein